MKTTRNTNLLGKSVLSAVVMLASTGVMAQENGNRDASGKIVRGPYETNRLFDNIWLGVGGGVNIYHGRKRFLRIVRQTAGPGLRPPCG